MNDQNTSPVRQSSTNGGLPKRAAAGLLTRRGLLAAGALTAAATALAGCGTAPAPDGAQAEATEGGSGSTLRVGMEAAYAPYNWQATEETEFTIPIENVSGAYADGYDVQIAKRVAEALGAEPVAVKLSFDGLIDALNNGQIDVIIAGMSDTEERRQSIDFSDPYIEDTIGIFVTKGSPYENATSLSDFAGATVMGQKATLYDDCIEEIEGVNHANPVDTMPAVLAQLAQGAVDAVTYPKMNEEGYMRSNENLVPIQFAEGKGFATTNPASVGYAKDYENASAVNDAVNAISDTERQEIWTAACDRQPA